MTVVWLKGMPNNQKGKEENHMKKGGGFYTKDYGNGIYSVSHPEWAGAAGPGEAVMQTWAVEGRDWIFAIDSPEPEVRGLRSYLEETFGKPVFMALTHGHIDHIGCNGQFEEVFLSRRDWPLLLGGGIHPLECPPEELEQRLTSLPYRLRNIEDYGTIDLGDRKLLCIPLPGHTPGSMLFYEEATRSLFSGDAAARRILYGMSGWIPVEEYLEGLRRLESYPIDRIFSMHDDFALGGDLPGRIVRNITEHLGRTALIWHPPGEETEFLQILLGKDEADPEYFSFVAPAEKVKGCSC